MGFGLGRRVRGDGDAVPPPAPGAAGVHMPGGHKRGDAPLERTPGKSRGDGHERLKPDAFGMDAEIVQDHLGDV